MTRRVMCPECDRYLGTDPVQVCPECGAAIADVDEFVGDEEYEGDGFQLVVDDDGAGDTAGGTTGETTGAATTTHPVT